MEPIDNDGMVATCRCKRAEVLVRTERGGAFCGNCWREQAGEVVRSRRRRRARVPSPA